MKLIRILLLIGFLAIASSTPGLAQDTPEQRTVHAIMFWMEGCPHCEEVIQDVLPPLSQEYGDQLKLLLIEVASAEDVDRLFQVAESFGLAREQTGVPFLIIGDQVLIGSEEVREQLPDLINQYLAKGGIDWPANPELKPYFPENEAFVSSLTESEVQLDAMIPIDTATVKPQNDGFTLAIAVMVGMVVSVVFSAFTFLNGKTYEIPAWVDWIILALILIGLGVAGYLTYIETQMVDAICGPVGDCNAVQTSPYARLFGILPVGLLGMLGYVGLLVAWLGRRFLPRFARQFTLAFWGMAMFAVIFSLYLTYLEPFVIGAVCMWCISSAVIVTLLLLLSTPLAVQHSVTIDEE